MPSSDVFLCNSCSIIAMMDVNLTSPLDDRVTLGLLKLCFDGGSGILVPR